MHILLRGSIAQRARLVSGLILFAFALTHFLNHALGLFSIDTMTQFQEWRTTVTRSLPGGLILGLALVVHLVLALGKLVSRTTLKLPPWELTQIVLGLAIPFSLFPHIVHTRFAHEVFGVDDIYFYELVQLWPGKAWEQTILLLVVWVHGCIGLHFWLRLTRWYDRVFPLMFALAVAIPIVSLAGFMVAGKGAARAVADPDTFDAIKQLTNWPDADDSQTLRLLSQQTKYGFYILLGILALVLAGRWIAQLMQPRVEISYVPTPTVRVTRGSSLLEISRMNGIPHLSVCGGRARCSTCRVEVLEGADRLPAPSGAEKATLEGINAGPHVRLACQLRPDEPITVKLLLRPHKRAARKNPDAQGVERELAVLFLDIRGFTSMSQDKLPYDVVFILNRLFTAAGAAITAQGGWIDKYLGDGLMAVFGRERGAEEGCRQAVRAAKRIDFALEEVNRDLLSELDTPLRIGMGLHVGPLVLGEIGHGDTAAMTVIGRTVNAASRLEAATKEMQCQIVVSAQAALKAGIDLSRYVAQEVAVRGLSAPLTVIAVKRARDLVEIEAKQPAQRGAGDGAA